MFCLHRGDVLKHCALWAIKLINRVQISKYDGLTMSGVRRKNVKLRIGGNCRKEVSKKSFLDAKIKRRCPDFKLFIEERSFKAVKH